MAVGGFKGNGQGAKARRTRGAGMVSNGSVKGKEVARYDGGVGMVHRDICAADTRGDGVYGRGWNCQGGFVRPCGRVCVWEWA